MNPNLIAKQAEYELDLVRCEGKGENEGNPWRINTLKVTLNW